MPPPDSAHDYFLASNQQDLVSSLHSFILMARRRIKMMGVDAVRGHLIVTAKREKTVLDWMEDPNPRDRTGIGFAQPVDAA